MSAQSNPTAAGSSNAMVASAAAGGFSSLASAYSQSNAMSSQGEYQAQQDEMNARLAESQAADAIARGDKTAKMVGDQGSSVLGSQRAALAAQGLEVDTGSAGDISNETQTLSAADVRTAKTNAWREAWGYKVQAVNSRNGGKFAQMASQNAAQSTILTGGLQAVSSGLRGYADYKKGQV